jgi:hypothetical protein
MLRREAALNSHPRVPVQHRERMGKMPCSRTTWSGALIALIAISVAATAAPTDAAAAKAPGGLSDAELKAIAPLFKRHDVIGVTESSSKGEPTSMTLAVRVKAPRAVAFSVLENPSNFYYLSTLFKENEIVQEHDNSKAWTWASRHSLFSVTGMNTIELFPPRRADIRIAKSSVGQGRTIRLSSCRGSSTSRRPSGFSATCSAATPRCARR